MPIMLLEAELTVPHRASSLSCHHAAVLLAEPLEARLRDPVVGLLAGPHYRCDQELGFLQPALPYAGPEQVSVQWCEPPSRLL